MKRAIKLMGVFAVLVCLAAAVRADEAKGTIKSIDTGRNEVVLKGTVKDAIYELNKDALVWLDGAKSKLSALSKDDRAIINYEKKGEHMIAGSVRALRNAQETTGKIADILPEKKEFTLKGTIKNTTYEMSKGGTVYVDGKKVALTDLRAGDSVLVTYEKHGDRLMAKDVTAYPRK
jgi:3-dehydroquinate synthase class II